MQRMYNILGGILFNLDALNLYMSRGDYPLKMLSDNKFIMMIVKFAKEVHRKDNACLSFNILKDMICRQHNIELKDLDKYEAVKNYFTIWDLAKDAFDEFSESTNYVSEWRLELKWAKKQYIRRKRLEISKNEHYMMKQQCFTLNRNCDECYDCPLKKICKKAWQDNQDALEFVQHWREGHDERLLCLLNEDSRVEVIDYHDNLRERIKHYDELVEAVENNEHGVVGIPFTSKTVNTFTGGLHKGQCIAIGARTGVGKTAWTLQEALNVWETTKVNVLYINLEMRKAEMMARLDSNTTETQFSHTISGKFGKKEAVEAFKKKLKEKQQIYEDKGYKNEFKILDISNMNLGELKYYMRHYYNRWGENFIIVLDNLNIMDYGTGKRNEAANEIARVYKQLIKQYNIYGIMLLQLNREAENERYIQPKHFRDADNLCDHMDGVFALVPMSKERRRIAFITVKGRSFVGSRVIFENRLDIMKLIEIENHGYSEESFDEDFDCFMG